MSIEDFLYAGTDFQQDPEFPLLPGEAWGPTDVGLECPKGCRRDCRHSSDEESSGGEGGEAMRNYDVSGRIWRGLPWESL
jgi:hypothetical protein